MNKKADRIKFIKLVNSKITESGLNVLKNKARFGNGTMYTISKEGKQVEITLREESDHKQVFSVFSRFNYSNKLTSYTNTKYNYHSFDFGGIHEYLNNIFSEFKN